MTLYVVGMHCNEASFLGPPRWLTNLYRPVKPIELSAEVLGLKMKPVFDEMDYGDSVLDDRYEPAHSGLWKAIHIDTLIDHIVKKTTVMQDLNESHKIELRIIEATRLPGPCVYMSMDRNKDEIDSRIWNAMLDIRKENGYRVPRDHYQE